VAFFLLQFQDEPKFVRLFQFDGHLFARGEFWRAFTYQFMQFGGPIVAGIVWPPALTLFLNLIVLSMMGLAVEDEWGTFHFLNFYLISTLTTAAVAAYLNTPLLGAFFINFTLLFVYASIYREQRFLWVIRAPFLAWFAFAFLMYGALSGIRLNVAVLIGAAAGYAYYLSQRVRVTIVQPKQSATSAEQAAINLMTRNLTRVAAMKKALSTGSQSDIDRLIALSEKDAIRGVNICPPVDYKPEHSDRYCVRCEGFAECTARHLQLNRPAQIEIAPGAVTES
jgi:membrane associated rhomboid family serine protease